MQIVQVVTDEEVLVEHATASHAQEGKLLSARIEACPPTGEQKNSRNGFHGFRLVMVYEEKA